MEDIVIFAEYLVKSIVKEPEMVKVKSFEDSDNNINLEIMVHNDDMGLVIGKGGKMINSIRTVIQAATYNKGIDRININVNSF